MNSASESVMLYRFGEGLDPDVLGEAAEALQTCDLFMTIGTSSVVYPAAGFAAQVHLLLDCCLGLLLAAHPFRLHRIWSSKNRGNKERKRKGKRTKAMPLSTADYSQCSPTCKH